MNLKNMIVRHNFFIEKQYDLGNWDNKSIEAIATGIELNIECYINKNP